MSVTLIDRTPGQPVVEQVVGRLLVEVNHCLARASRAPVESLDADALGEAVSELARIESRHCGSFCRLAVYPRRRTDGDWAFHRRR
jgi:hypothetical protein